VRPGVEVHRRHAYLGEAELVRAIKETAIRELVGLDHTPLLLRDTFDNLVDGRFAEADVGNVMCMTPDVAAVVVQVRGDLARRERRVRGIVPGAQQALLFRPDQRYQNRPT